MDRTDHERDAIHEAIQANTATVQFATDGAILTGWLVIAEWMDKDGDRWLSNCRAPHIALWTAKGIAHEYLFGNWPDDDTPDS